MADAYYLDTSALVKRYVSERGSESIDQIFTNAHSGEATIASSYWNVGEAAVVFDKYGRVLTPRRFCILCSVSLRRSQPSRD